MKTEEITVENPTKKRKWGWGYNLFSNRDGSIDSPGMPVYEGTLNQVDQDKSEDRTYRAHRINTSHSTAWFYRGQRVTATWRFGLLKAAEDLTLDWDDPLYDQKNDDHHWHNDKYGYGWFRGFPGTTWEGLLSGEVKVKVVSE